MKTIMRYFGIVLLVLAVSVGVWLLNDSVTKARAANYYGLPTTTGFPVTMFDAGTNNRWLPGHGAVSSQFTNQINAGATNTSWPPARLDVSGGKEVLLQAHFAGAAASGDPIAVYFRRGATLETNFEAATWFIWGLTPSATAGQYDDVCTNLTVNGAKWLYIYSISNATETAARSVTNNFTIWATVK